MLADLFLHKQLSTCDPLLGEGRVSAVIVRRRTRVWVSVGLLASGRVGHKERALQSDFVPVKRIKMITGEKTNVRKLEPGPRETAGRPDRSPRTFRETANSIKGKKGLLGACSLKQRAVISNVFTELSWTVQGKRKTACEKK